MAVFIQAHLKFRVCFAFFGPNLHVRAWPFLSMQEKNDMATKAERV